MEKKDNLETFINLLIKMVEASEKHNKEQHDEIHITIKTQSETINKIEEELVNLRINGAVINAISKSTNNNTAIDNKLRNKLIIAITTFLVTASTIIIKFHTEIFKYISGLFK